MAIHQKGFQWQAITRLPGSSACCLCCCCSLGPQLPNSPWKQYLYIYYIFTQYLPCCKTISYLTINSPMFLPPPLFFLPCLFPAPFSTTVTSVSLYLSFFFEWCFFFCFTPQFHFFHKRFFFPSPHLSFRPFYFFNFVFFSFLCGRFFSHFLFALYIDEIGFFCSPMEDNHCGNCHLIAKFHSTVKGRNTGERALKKTVIASISIAVAVSDLLSSSLP